MSQGNHKAVCGPSYMRKLTFTASPLTFTKRSTWRLLAKMQK